MFQFKQFSVDQSGCAMKINTDGVLLGALASADDPKSILDVGTGTGVIALMLAQRFTTAKIDAVEIDGAAAQTAGRNFKSSPFAERLTLFPLSFENYFDEYPAKKYDLIISNPPFHLNSLESPLTKKTIAKHADNSFFEQLMKQLAAHLTPNGLCWLILPLQAADLVKGLANNQYQLHLQKVISVRSFKDDKPHREILCFSHANTKLITERFVIYDKPKVYSAMYSKTLKDFLIIF